MKQVMLDPFDIPKFLRRKRDAQRVTSGAVVITSGRVFANSLPQLSADPLAALIQSGRYAPSALLDPGGREMLLEMEAEREKKESARTATKLEEREQRRAQWDGFIKISALIEETGARRKDIVMAVHKAGIITVKGMIRPDEADKARAAIKAYKPPPARGGKAGGSRHFPPDAVIRVKKGAKNPKKPGTATHKWWEGVFAADGWTIKKFVEKGGGTTSLLNATRQGYVTVGK